MKEIFNDLREDDGNLRGFIGELIAMKHIRNSIKPTPNNLNVLTKLSCYGKINDRLYNLLKKYWLTIDLIRFVKNEQYPSKIKIEIFEVKTKKFYNKFKAKWLAHSLSKRVVDLQNECKKLNNVEVKFAYVVLFRDWKYRVKIKDLNPKLFSVRDFSKRSRWNYCKPRIDVY